MRWNWEHLGIMEVYIPPFFARTVFFPCQIFLPRPFFLFCLFSSLFAVITNVLLYIPHVWDIPGLWLYGGYETNLFGYGLFSFSTWRCPISEEEMSGWALLLLEGKPGEEAILRRRGRGNSKLLYLASEQQHMRFTPHMKRERERHT
ncbi:hypothetical protein F4818DRAFT_373501 [Hypoxylon cercidicola]|nr:hypothetical protein F4818DRAFT_373501 [Hypoxylon cercidicola]